LNLQNGNVKALYRRGLARKGLGRYEEALTGWWLVKPFTDEADSGLDIQGVRKVDSGNTLAIDEEEEIKGLIQQKQEQAVESKQVGVFVTGMDWVITYWT